MRAVEQDGLALQYASTEIQKEIVMGNNSMLTYSSPLVQNVVVQEDS